MPIIRTQSDFRRASKPNFCYLCGRPLSDEQTNRDHCPPKSLFLEQDRENYALILETHASCNSNWSESDKLLAILFDALHGTGTWANPKHRKQLSFVPFKWGAETKLALNNLPLRPLVFRILRFMHALLYGDLLPQRTNNSIFFPIPESDREDRSRPIAVPPETLAFSKALCTAQAVGAYDAVRAYNGKFSYVCTWSRMGNDAAVCLFAFDIYRMADIGLEIADYPRCVIGAYLVERPARATEFLGPSVEPASQDLLYPIIF